MSLAPPERVGPLRRERLRTARLYFVCDARPGGEDPEALLRAALSGGVDIVQLREKELGRAEIERAAATFRRVCDTYSALFIVNDDPDLARACDADGVHVGQDDVSVEEARELLGPGRDHRPLDPLRGADRRRRRARRSTTSASARSGRRRRKPGGPAVGLELVSHAAEHAAHPFFAIGGIDAAQRRAGRRAPGRRRLCVVRAIRDAADPAAAPPKRCGAQRREWRPVADGGRAGRAAQAQASARGADRMERGYAKAEQRNQEAREALEPLAEGERPRW